MYSVPSHIKYLEPVSDLVHTSYFEDEDSLQFQPACRVNISASIAELQL